jgi:hypothetical protein
MAGHGIAPADVTAFVEHLESCPKCKKHVRAMGSFSNQLWELGDIAVPSDLDSTILFKFKQPVEESGKPKSKKPKTLVFAVSILIIGFIGYLGWSQFVKPPQSPSEVGDAVVDEDAPAGDEAVTVTAQITKGKKPVSDSEAKALFGQLQQMADSLAPIANMNDEKSPKKADAQEEGAASSDKSQKAEEVSAPDSYPIHWHIPYYDEARIKQLSSTIQGLGITLDYEDQDFLVFTTTSEKIKLLREGIQFMDQLNLGLPELLTQGTFPDMKIPTSIYFVKQGSLSSETLDIPSNQRRDALVSFEERTFSNYTYFDWHFLPISSQQDTLLDVIRRRGGAIQYTSDEVIIFSVPGSGLVALAEEIQNMGSVFADFGNMEFNASSPMKGTIHIMIYFSQQ